MAEKPDALSHPKWDCKYHIVSIPKYRSAVLYRELCRYLGGVFHDFANQKESRIEGDLLVDHVHMLISVPPKYAMSQVVGYIRGKSAIHLARNFAGCRQNFSGYHFWARGYYVSTIDRDEEIVRRNIREQQDEVKRLEQLRMFD